ncbi:cysteine hydrolase [Hoyosella sp. YIM 151337]|uniref:cysteine hydrolase family protein n=1 Tax=Hoyosella sp. YIM 151337 TaxID=2992742 RepID=UPI00223665EA|nr:isochorismatase family cysteine hydrolase [Hoyosella sp. YIM 151337]MCW4353027.1 cysteine hydrolase [Hoyosella sp. YIM 151337]
MHDKPNPGASALITIDVQHDFSHKDGAAYIDGTEEILPNIGRVVRGFRAAGKPIVHVIRLYSRDGSNAELCRREAVANSGGIVAPDSAGSQLVAGLRPDPGTKIDPEFLLRGGFQEVAPNEWIMFKPRWGAFYQTGLHDHLTGIGVDTLTFVGVNFPNCPRASIYQAGERDFRVIVVSDAVSQVYERGLAECRGIGVRVHNCTEVLAWIGQPQAHQLQ